MKKLLIASIAVYTCVMFASLVMADAGAGKLAAERCSACHSTSRICDKLGSRTPEVWKQTVARMVSNGAKLSADEARGVADYLGAAKAGSQPLCK